MTEDQPNTEDAIDALLARARPAAPADAADRVLRRLPGEAVRDALFWAEAGRLARRALPASAAAALVSLAALAAAIALTPAAGGLPRAAPATAASPRDVPGPAPADAPRSVTDVARLLVSAERDAARSGTPRFFERR